MSTSKPAKPRPWYSPALLADFANNGFLSVARGTGAVVRGIQSGSSKGVSVIVKPLQKKADPPAKRPPGRPLAVQMRDALAGRKTAAAVAPKPAPVAASPAPPPTPAPASRVAPADPAPATSPPIATEAEFAPTTRSEIVPEADIESAPKPPAPSVAPRKLGGEGQESGGVTGFFRSLLKGEAKPEAKPEAATFRDRPGQPAAQPAIPKQPVDVEAVVAQHQFASRADMLSALVSVNEFFHGSARESSDAQKQILSIGATLAEPVFLAALQRKSPKLAELAFDGLARLKSEKLVPTAREMLSSPDRELRLAGLRAAHWLDDEEARPLFAMAARDPAPEVRRRMVCYLSWRGAPWAIFELRRLCNDDSPPVKWSAIVALTRVQPDVAVDLMGRSPPSEQDSSYRRRIEAALARKKAGGDAARSPADRRMVRPPEGPSQP
jgi:HEAT repeat protein